MLVKVSLLASHWSAGAATGRAGGRLGAGGRGAAARRPGRGEQISRARDCEFWSVATEPVCGNSGSWRVVRGPIYLYHPIQLSAPNILQSKFVFIRVRGFYYLALNVHVRLDEIIQ